MFTRLKRYVYPALGALVLCAAAVITWPSPAQAQAASAYGTRNADAGATRVVVNPGDSLWSISERLLPANANPQQTYDEVARIYALNKHRIGEDPNLIYAGQVLDVTPARGPVVERAKFVPADRGQEEPVPAEGTADKAATSVDASQRTAQVISRGIPRPAAEEQSGVSREQPLPGSAREGLAAQAGEVPPKAASDDGNTLPAWRILVAAAGGMAIAGGAVCLVLALVFFAARKPHKRRVRTEPSPNSPRGRGPTRVPYTSETSTATLKRSAQDPWQPRRQPLRKARTRILKGGRY